MKKAQPNDYDKDIITAPVSAAATGKWVKWRTK